MTLLTIVGDAAERLGLSRPANVMASLDENAKVLRGLAQEEGKALARRHSWQALQTEHTFATVDTTVSYALPTGFDRILTETVFNRTRRRRMVGDLSPQQWQETQSSLVTMVNPAFRIRGGLFLISPTPNSVETIAYEYMTKNWCSAGAAWVADSDTGILDEELMTLGVIWRFKSKKGFDYAEDMNGYELELANAIFRDGAPTRIQTANVERDRVPHAPVMPETLIFS